MVLPSSGQLSLVSDIADEQHRPTGSSNLVSIADCGLAAGFTSPFAFSDFYSYKHITRDSYDLLSPDQTTIGVAEASSVILNNQPVCTIQLLGRFDNTTSGVLYESGGALSGLAIYITSGGVLYCVAGDGSTTTGDLSLSKTLTGSDDIREIVIGIEFSPFIRGVMYINGTVANTSNIGGQVNKVSGSGLSGTGNVYGGIRGTVGPTTSAMTNGYISACNIWTTPIKALIPPSAAPVSNILDRVSYTSGDYFTHNVSNDNSHGVWGSPDNNNIYLLQRDGTSSVWKYTLSSPLDPTTADGGTSLTYTGIVRSEGFVVSYQEGDRVFYSEDGSPPNICRADLGTNWDPTSSLNNETIVALSDGFFGTLSRAPQGVDLYETYSTTAITRRLVIMDQTGYLEVRNQNLTTVYSNFVIDSSNVSGWTNITNLSALRFFYGGYKLLLTSTSDIIYELDLSTPYDFTTLTYPGKSINLNTFMDDWGSGSMRGIWANPHNPEATGIWVTSTNTPNQTHKIDLSY